MADPSCIFCKIVAGEIPSQQIYSDDHVVAFLDINPVATGHALVLPREHAEFLWQLSEPSLAALGVVCARVASAIKDVVGAEALNVLQNNGNLAGQLVGHVHFHLIPRFAGDEFHYNWPGRSADKDGLAALGKRIAQHLG